MFENLVKRPLRCLAVGADLAVVGDMLGTLANEKSCVVPVKTAVRGSATVVESNEEPRNRPQGQYLGLISSFVRYFTLSWCLKHFALPFQGLTLARCGDWLFASG